MPVCKVMTTVFWDPEGIILIDYLYVIALLQENSTPIWLENVERHRKKRDEEIALRCDVSPGQCTYSHKHGVPSEIPVSNCSITYCIHQIWPQWLLVVSKAKLFHERTEICWR